MRIVIVTPAPPGSRAGNRVTALRWARLLRELGHAARVRTRWEGEDCDVLVALHARKSAASALAFRRAHPGRPLVVALGGTELYPSLGRSPLALRACEAADRLIVLHRPGAGALPPRLRRKSRIVLQSAEGAPSRPSRRSGTPAPLRACVLAHLRPVKDPFLTERAARLLPPGSRVEVLHAGAALSDAMARRATAATARGGRWRWLGALPRARALGLLRT